MSCLPRHSTILFGMRFRTTPEWRGTRRKESFSGSWDTPAQGTSTHPLLKGIYDATVKITEADSKMAYAEWKRVMHEEGSPQFSAMPSVNLRPAGAGVDIVIRYITRAPE
jgi:hypothetical protein